MIDRTTGDHTTATLAAAAACALILGLALAPPAAAQAKAAKPPVFVDSPVRPDCVSLSETVFDTSFSCSSEPSIDRVFGSQEWVWHGGHYLVLNEGNEISVRDVLTPRQKVTTSEFWIPLFGDTDYGMLNFSLCDDCRFGYANFINESITFEVLERNEQPRFDNQVEHGISQVPGGYTYTNNGEQYLIAQGLDEECPNSALLKWGDEVDDLGLVQCMGNLRIVAGERIGNWLFLAEESQYLLLYEITEEGLEYHAIAGRTYAVLDKGFSVDVDNQLLVIANQDGATLYDLSDLPTMVELSHIDGWWNRASLRNGWLTLARKGKTDSEVLYRVANPSAPRLLSYFPHADSSCAAAQAVRVLDDSIYLMRFSLGERYDLSGCYPITHAAEPAGQGPAGAEEQSLW